MENQELSYPSAAPLHGGLPVAHPAPAGPATPSGEGSPFGESRQGTLGRARRRIGSIIAAAAALVAKFFATIKAGLLLLTKVKLLATAATALVSVAAYSLFWGWTFALGFVILLFVHEMGHVLQLRREGLTASTPKFVPFMGAFIRTNSFGANALAEARVGLAGPVLGTLGAAVCFAVAEATGSDFFRALAYIGFFLNLFNLLPIVPLDGGRAMAAMAPWMWFLGFGVLVALDFLSPNFILLIITVFAGMELYRRWEARRSGSIEHAAYYRVSPRNRLLVGTVYIGLIVLLALGMSETHILSSGSHSFTHL